MTLFPSPRLVADREKTTSSVRTFVPWSKSTICPYLLLLNRSPTPIAVVVEDGAGETPMLGAEEGVGAVRATPATRSLMPWWTPSWNGEAPKTRRSTQPRLAMVIAMPRNLNP